MTDYEEKNNEDELDKFFVDEAQPIDKKILAEIIEPFVENIGKNGVVRFNEKFENLFFWEKILVYLICRKIMFLKEVLSIEEVGPKEISEHTKISESAAKKISLDNNLKKFTQKKNNGYYIPNYNLRKVKEILIKNE